MMGASTFDDLIKAGKAKFEGDRKPFDQLRSLMVVFHAELRDIAGHGAESTFSWREAFRSARSVAAKLGGRLSGNATTGPQRA
jgi:hypothetical protein